MFEILLDPLAEKQLQKLPKDLQKRLVQKLDSARMNPIHFFERLSGRTEYKLRIGKYRVIASIDFAEHKILIHLIGHRKNVYEKL